MEKQNTPTLSDYQVECLSRPFIGMVGRITAFYDDPANERAFQERYVKTYGHQAPQGAQEK